MRTPFSRLSMLAVLVALVVALTPSIASAAPVDTPLFAGYWGQFLDHWVGFFSKQRGVVMVALGVGAVSLFIITRGKWRK